MLHKLALAITANNEYQSRYLFHVFLQHNTDENIIFSSHLKNYIKQFIDVFSLLTETQKLHTLIFLKNRSNTPYSSDELYQIFTVISKLRIVVLSPKYRADVISTFYAFIDELQNSQYNPSLFNFFENKVYTDNTYNNNSFLGSIPMLKSNLSSNYNTWHEITIQTHPNKSLITAISNSAQREEIENLFQQIKNIDTILENNLSLNNLIILHKKLLILGEKLKTIDHKN